MSVKLLSNSLLILAMPALLHCAGRLGITPSQPWISALPGQPLTLSVYRRTGPLRLPETNCQVTGGQPGNLDISQNGAQAVVRFNRVSTLTQLTLQVKSRTDTAVLVLPVRLPQTDTDHDGYPDAAELGSASDSYREWFCAIALAQYFQPSDNWADARQDCGGLVEYAAREALKNHDSAWRKKQKTAADFPSTENLPYHWPEVPFLGKSIFRVKPGVFSPRTVGRDFSDHARGTLLRTHSMNFVSRRLDDLKKGDILFFFHTGNLKMPSHAMIFLGGDPARVLYHTGPDEESRGSMRLVLLYDLLRHPDPSWRPDEQNPDFNGIYRWKFLL